MTTPVFVIHGIGARDAESFAATARKLADDAGVTAHPVFWGDLGARTAWIERTVPGSPTEEVRDDDIPGAENVAVAEFLAGGFAAEVRDDEVPQLVLDAALGTEIRDRPDAQDVERALREEWPGTRWLVGVADAEVLQAVGEALTGPLTDGVSLALPLHTAGEHDIRDGDVFGGPEVRGVDVVGFVKRRIGELDRVVGAVLGAAGGRVNSHLRTSMLPAITQYIGDVLVYQRHRERIHDRVRQVVADVDPRLGRSPERPVDVLAHSLGGVIAVDMATGTDPLWIRTLVTFGSQSPFFHVCDPRGGALAPFEGGSLVRLPRSIGGWINLWEPLDALAFIAARVFELHDGSAPDDRAVRHLASSGLWSHSAYWALESVADVIGRALAPSG